MAAVPCAASRALGQAEASNPDMAKPLPVRDFEDALATLRDGDGAAAGTFREECQRRFPGADFLNMK